MEVLYKTRSATDLLKVVDTFKDDTTQCKLIVCIKIEELAIELHCGKLCSPFTCFSFFVYSFYVTYLRSVMVTILANM